MHPRAVAAKPPRTGTVVKEIDVGLRLGVDAQHLSLLCDCLVEEEVSLVETNRRAQRLFGRANAGDVIDVGVRQQI